MPMTVANYKAQMKHAIGGEPDSRVDLLQVLNDALRYLYNQHAWSFRERPILTVTTTPDQNYVELPEDFGELISVQFATRNVSLTSLTDIAHRRANTLLPPPQSAVYVALSFPAQVDVTSSQPLPRLEIFPDVISADDYDIEYRGGPIALTEDSDVPNIPPDYERVLTLLARSFTCDIEEQDSTVEWDKANVEIERLKDHDALTQSNMGQMQGGAAQQNGRRVNFFMGSTSAR